MKHNQTEIYIDLESLYFSIQQKIEKLDKLANKIEDQEIASQLFNVSWKLHKALAQDEDSLNEVLTVLEQNLNSK